MELEGKLATFPLRDVLRFIEEKGHTGRLSLRMDLMDDGFLEEVLGREFEETLVISIGRFAGLRSFDYLKTWTEMLVRCGLISRWDLREFSKGIPGQSRDLPEVAANRLGLSNEDLLRCAEFHVRETVTWLFSGKTGSFSFRFADDIVPFAGLETVSLGDLTEKGLQWSADLRKLFEKHPDPKSVLIPATPPEERMAQALAVPEWEVLSRIDGSRNLRGILRTSAYPCDETAAILSSLLEKGLLAFEAGPKAGTAAGSFVAEEESGRFGGGLLKRFLGRRESEPLPEEKIGRYAMAVNRLLEKVRDKADEALEREWESLTEQYPGASVLRVESMVIDPYSLGNRVALWGGRPEDWTSVKQDCEEALIRFFGRIVEEIQLVEGKRKADAWVEKATSDLESAEALLDS